MITEEMLREIHKGLKDGKDVAKFKVYLDTGYGAYALKAVKTEDGKIILSTDTPYTAAMANPHPERVQ